MSRDRVFKMPENRPPMPPAIAIDRLGKLIEAGHLILFHAEEDLIFEVTDVRPVLNPGMVAAGKGAMQITLAAKFPVQCAAAVANRGMVIVGETEARIQARAMGNGQPMTTVPSTGLVLTDAPNQAVDVDEE